MKTIVLSVVLLSIFSVGVIQGKNEGGEPSNGRIKRYYGHHGSRPTYGGYQTFGGYQQQPSYANQRPQPQSAHGVDSTSYQQPNYNQGFGNMGSSGYYQPSHQQDHLRIMRYQ